MGWKLTERQRFRRARTGRISCCKKNKGLGGGVAKVERKKRADLRYKTEDGKAKTLPADFGLTTTGGSNLEVFTQKVAHQVAGRPSHEHLCMLWKD